MLLILEPQFHAQMPESWRSVANGWLIGLGFDLNSLGEVEYSPEADVLWATVYRTHPESGTFYFNEKVGEAASDRVILFLDPRTTQSPGEIFLREWERAMIAYQGRQGA